LSWNYYFQQKKHEFIFLKLCFVFLSFGVGLNECQKHKTSMDMMVDDGLQENVNTLMPFELKSNTYVKALST
jgi:hypothetical protein